jgi:hypothetical protein
VIEKEIDSGDDVSMAVATLFLQRINNGRSQQLLIKLGASDVPRGLLTDSVIKTGQVQSELANATKDERVNRWQKMATDPNPYSRIAAAKALCATDPNAAKAALLKLEEERSEISPTANRIRRELAEYSGEEVPPPVPVFETLYTGFERGAGSVARIRFVEAKNNSSDDTRHEPSSAMSPSPLSPVSAKLLKPKPAPGQGEEPAPSTPWSIIIVLIVTAGGLLWLLLKRRS